MSSVSWAFGTRVGVLILVSALLCVVVGVHGAVPNPQDSIQTFDASIEPPLLHVYPYVESERVLIDGTDRNSMLNLNGCFPRTPRNANVPLEVSPSSRASEAEEVMRVRVCSAVSSSGCRGDDLLDLSAGALLTREILSHIWNSAINFRNGVNYIDDTLSNNGSL